MRSSILTSSSRILKSWYSRRAFVVKTFTHAHGILGISHEHMTQNAYLNLHLLDHCSESGPLSPRLFGCRLHALCRQLPRTASSDTHNLFHSSLPQIFQFSLLNSLPSPTEIHNLDFHFSISTHLLLASFFLHMLQHLMLSAQLL